MKHELNNNNTFNLEAPFKAPKICPVPRLVSSLHVVLQPRNNITPYITGYVKASPSNIHRNVASHMNWEVKAAVMLIIIHQVQGIQQVLISQRVRKEINQSCAAFVLGVVVGLGLVIIIFLVVEDVS